jgi:hypothetical protein
MMDMVELKVSIRLKLSDFIDTDLEKDIMEMISKSHKDLPSDILVYFWYNDKEITNKNLENFILRWEDKLKFKTIIKKGSDLKFGAFVWWDIVSDKLSIVADSKTRYTYRYYSFDQILDGLKEFYKCAQFVLSEKPRSRPC